MDILVAELSDEKQHPVKLRLRAMETRPIEAAYCLFTSCWSISLLLPGDGFGDSPSFGPMKAVAPDWGWGLFALCIAITRIVGVSGNILVLRLLAAIGGGIIWTFTALTMIGAYFAYGGAITGPAIYGPLAVVNFAVFVKIMRSCCPPGGSGGGSV